MERKIIRGEIYIADFDSVIGSEQVGERPVLVIQNNKDNRYSPTVIVLAITSRCHIVIECQTFAKGSITLVE